MIKKGLFAKELPLLTLSVILSFALLLGTSALAQDTKVALSDTVTTALEYSPRSKPTAAWLACSRLRA